MAIKRDLADSYLLGAWKMTIIEHEISFGSKEICKMTLVAIKLDIFIQNVVERIWNVKNIFLVLGPDIIHTSTGLATWITIADTEDYDQPTKMWQPLWVCLCICVRKMKRPHYPKRGRCLLQSDLAKHCALAGKYSMVIFKTTASIPLQTYIITKITWLNCFHIGRIISNLGILKKNIRSYFKSCETRLTKQIFTYPVSHHLSNTTNSYFIEKNLTSQPHGLFPKTRWKPKYSKTPIFHHFSMKKLSLACRDRL